MLNPDKVETLSVGSKAGLALGLWPVLARIVLLKDQVYTLGGLLELLASKADDEVSRSAFYQFGMVC